MTPPTGPPSRPPSSSPRVLVAHCPHWALVVAGYEPSAEVVVVYANRVVVASPAAQAAGVRVGMCRREAQGACPDVDVVQRDVANEARQWELAVAAVEAFAPGVEVLSAGELALAPKGPSRYLGGDHALALKVVGAVSDVVAALVPGGRGAAWAGCCQVGVADGFFAARLAARLAAARGGGMTVPPGRGLVIPPGATPRFLAALPLRALLGDEPTARGGSRAPLEDLVDLLERLGVKKLGDLAALPVPAVLSRFGPIGLQAHRLATGLVDRAVQGRQPPPDWARSAELDPPADQLQAAVFLGRALAEELQQHLVVNGLVCTRLAIEAETEHGTTLRRSWRHDGALSAAAIGERVRWQLEGWAQASADAAQAGRITKLSLVPEEVCPDNGRQLGFWGGDAGAEARATRAFARAQSLLGPGSVLTAVLQGGRDYREQVHFVPWGEPRLPIRPGEHVAPAQPARPRRRKPSSKAVDGPPPWPGRLPGLAPAVVYGSPLPAQVLDANGAQVSVGSRGVISARPAWLAVGGANRVAIEAWAGPWPLEERWWEAGGRRRARLQLSASDGNCYLLAREGRRWLVEATYD